MEHRHSQRRGIGTGIGVYSSIALLAALLLLPAWTTAAAPKPVLARPANAAVAYNRDVRPILTDNCFPCHGPDRNKRMAGLRLDLRDDALAHGAIVPGKPEASKLIARINVADEGERMPPVSFHKSLTAVQKGVLKRWIAAGAVYELHWAYIPPKRPSASGLKDPRYPVRNPVDAFIRAKLRAEHILPSPEADRRTLIRRVSLDLTGLPPTPDEVRAFLADRAPNAYEKVVDRLLASSHYGERMATPWLDVVRYADTVGFHGDQNQNAWPYRDYVVSAFNANEPFDKFTVEQLAGDLLPNPGPAQLTATCFNRLTMMTREGGAQPKEYLAKYAADRVRTVGMTWMGSTLGCTECHDHKYDPFTQKDFYSLEAFFADVKQWGVYADYSYTPNPDLKGYNNDYPFPPERKVHSPYLLARIRRLEKEIDSLALASGAGFAHEDAARKAFDEWRSRSVGFLATNPQGWETPEPEVSTSAAAPKAIKGSRPARATAKPSLAAVVFPSEAESGCRVESDNSVAITRNSSVDLKIAVSPHSATVVALQVEALPAADGDHTVFRAGPDGKPVETGMLTLTGAVLRKNGSSEPLPFRYAASRTAEPRYRSGFEIVGVQAGWPLARSEESSAEISVWLPAHPVRLDAGDRLLLTFPRIPAARIRVSDSPLVPELLNRPEMPANLRAALDHPDSDAARGLALREYLLGTAWNTESFDQAWANELEIAGCRGGITPVMVTEASPNPLTVRVLPRGNWQDESGAIVQPNVPHFLPDYQAEPPHRLTRLDLANWLVSRDNTLTARVFVNRLWKQFFGNGLTAQVEDLGTQGEWPSHPELLDWLAVEFRDRGWDVKHMVRLLVTSATYRESSSLRPELRTVDPNNRLLASQNPRRLEAEFVRDNALAISGLLNTDVGGPPCKLYQPAGYYANIQFPDRPYTADSDDRQWRRGIYVHWQRTFLHPELLNFDAPSREDCIASRTVSNTPQQALTLLNDPTFVEAARAFAASILAAPGESDAARMDAAYERALARPAKPAEKQSLLTFLNRARTNYRTQPDDAKKLLAVGVAPARAGQDPVELAAWATVCRVILNLNETITRY